MLSTPSGKSLPSPAATATTAASDSDLQRLWADQQSLHASATTPVLPQRGHPHLSPRCTPTAVSSSPYLSAICSPLASTLLTLRRGGGVVVQSKASLVDRSPVLLVLTFNPVVKKSPDGLGQPKLVWLKYSRSAASSYTFKKAKPLKLLQRLVCGPPPAAELTLVDA